MSSFAKTSAAKKAPKKTAAAPKAMTKAQVMSDLAAKTSLTKAQVTSVISEMCLLIEAELKAGRPASVPGLVKITLSRKPATASRPGRNPFTGEDIMIKAKPARNVVKVRALKALKDMA